MKTKKFEIKIRSISPLLFNTRQRDLDLEIKKLKKDQLEEWEQNNWRRKAELNSNGDVVLPARWFRAAFIEGCKFTKIVPHFATSKRQTYTKYASSMLFNEGTFRCKPSKLKDYGAFVGAQGANSSTKVWRIRPMIDEWETTFEIIDTGNRMLLDELKQIIGDTGMVLGVGDGRSLGFGRFEVVSITEK